MKNFLALLAKIDADANVALGVIIHAGPVIASIGGSVGAEIVAVATAIVAIETKLTAA